MSRAFSLQAVANDNLDYDEGFFVEDGDDVRFHDVAIVLRHLLKKVEACGSDRVPTKSQVAAENLRRRAAEATMKEWAATGDGVGMTSVDGVVSYSRTFVKKGYTEPVEAPCNPNGTANLATTDALSKWEPAGSAMAEV